MNTCHQCGNEAAHRCSRCKKISFCSRACQKKAWPLHKKECMPPSSPLAVAMTPPSEMDGIFAQLQTKLTPLQQKGWCIIDVGEERARMFDAFMGAWKGFFAKSSSFKEGFRTPVHTAYSTPYPGLHEMFEHKQVDCHPSFKCPSETSKETEEVFTFCEQVALLALQVMLEHVAKSNNVSSWKWSSTNFPVSSTLRVLHYDRATPQVATSALEDAFPDHTDSSLITVSPPSTLPALEMKRFDTGE